MRIDLDLGQTGGNHDNMNAVPAVDSVISAGSVINTDGDVVAGVAVSLAANPFTTVEFSGANQAYAEELDTVEQRFLRLNASSADAEVVFSGLPAGLYTVEIFGSRNTADDAPATLAVTTIADGTVSDTYNAANTGAYAEHVATVTVTLETGEDLVAAISHPTGTGLYAYGNRLSVEGVVPAMTAATGDQGADIVADGEQDFTFLLVNVPSGEVPVSARIGSTAGVGGTTLTGLTYATTASAGEYLCTADLASGIVTGSTSEVYELSATTEIP